MEPKGCRRFLFRGERLHPLWRAVIYLAGLLVAELGCDLLLGLVYVIGLSLTGRPLMEALGVLAGGAFPRFLLLGTSLTRLGTALGLALLLGHFLDREPAATMGLCPTRVGRDSLLGIALGLATMLAVGGACLALSQAAVQRGTATPREFLVDAVALLPLAAAEEVAFRGYLQRLLVTWRGPAVGVMASSVLFALFHALNPNLSLVGLINIALAGATFAWAVERTGTLWLAVGYHFAWNLAQGPLLGLPVSGMPWEGLLGLGTGGPSLLTGGAFGPEGGLLATAVLLLSLLPLWTVTRRPATLVAVSRRQRAAVEARFGPLPYLHHSLHLGSRFLDDARHRLVGTGRREGEVVLLLRRADRRVLVHTKSFYPGGTYRLPSGGIRSGESVMDAACREAAEETGLTIGQACPVGLVSYLLRHGSRRLFFHSWLVSGQVTGEAAPNDLGEHISGFRWVEPEALSQVADQLRTLPPEWSDWGRFRALAHDAARGWWRW